MYEFMQLVHLRENGYDKQKYRKTKSRYIPDFEPGHCQNCGIKMEQACTFVAMPVTRISKQKYCKMNEKGK